MSLLDDVRRELESKAEAKTAAEQTWLEREALAELTPTQLHAKLVEDEEARSLIARRFNDEQRNRFAALRRVSEVNRDFHVQAKTILSLRKDIKMWQRKAGACGLVGILIGFLFGVAVV